MYITSANEPGFIKVVLRKLKGPARESAKDKRFDRMSELIAYLENDSPRKKNQLYFEAIVNLRIKQTETLNHYYNRVQGLLSGAKHAHEEKYTVDGKSEIMIKSVIVCAHDAFIRDLPDEMSTFVDTRNPKTIHEAFDHALHAEERQKYVEKSRVVASAYHVSRKNERPSEQFPLRSRSPTPYDSRWI